MTNKKITTALIDADIIAHQVAIKFQSVVAFGDTPFPVVDIDFDSACLHFDSKINDICEALKDYTGADEVLPVLCFSDKKNFRKDAYPLYKHNRKNVTPVLMKGRLKEYGEEKYRVSWDQKAEYFSEYYGLEADDKLGILATLGIFSDPVICTTDKDLLQVPGWHYNWQKDHLIEITPEEGQWHRWMQVLTGDPTDGYKGLPGCGKKKAEKILSQWQDWQESQFDSLEEAYEHACWEAYQETAEQNNKWSRQLEDLLEELDWELYVYFKAMIKVATMLHNYNSDK